MYRPAEMTNASTPSSWFYSLNTHTHQKIKIKFGYPSRQKILFFLDSCSTISVLNFPTSILLEKPLNITRNGTFKTSRTLFVANQTEIAILHYVTVTLNTTIDESR